ncbi:unnamed protein product, partial [Laminaria digitata]
MQANGIKPDQIAFGTAVSACAMGGQWERARSLLAEMRRSNLRPDSAVCTKIQKQVQTPSNLSPLNIETRADYWLQPSSAVKACGMDGRWEEALGLLTEMQEIGVRPNLITY